MPVAARALFCATVAALCGIVLGCSAPSTSSDRVSRRWLARVPREHMGKVNEARAARDDAELAADAVHAKERELQASLREARKAHGGARDDAVQKRALLEAALDEREPEVIERARGALGQSEEQAATLKARLDELEHAAQVQLARAERADAQLEWAEAKVAFAEYQAVAQSGDVRAQELSEADFRKALERAEARVAKAEQQLQERISKREQP
jgi:hypothetical protein